MRMSVCIRLSFKLSAEKMTFKVTKNRTPFQAETYRVSRFRDIITQIHCHVTPYPFMSIYLFTSR